MRVLTASEVHECTDVVVLMNELESAFRQVSDETAVMPVRLTLPIRPHSAVQVVMPAYLPDHDTLVTKVVGIYPGNQSRGLPQITGIVLLNDAKTGMPLGVIDGAAITEFRTAAASALSVQLLARRDSRVLTVFGTGVQARAHVRAIAAASDLSAVRVVGRTAESTDRFASECELVVACPVTSHYGAAEQAVRGADIVVLATSASEPIVRADWIDAGTHICAIGSHAPHKRELDSATVARADLVAVDTRAGALAEAGDLQLPISEGVFSPDRMMEIGDLLIGKASGRQSDEAVTLYKSVGMAAMDAVAARHVYRQAINRGVGTEVPI